MIFARICPVVIYSGILLFSPVLGSPNRNPVESPTLVALVARNSQGDQNQQNNNFLKDFIEGAKDYLTWDMTDIPFIEGKKENFIVAVQTCRNFFDLDHNASSSLDYEAIAMAVKLISEETRSEDLYKLSVMDIYAAVHVKYDRKYKQDYREYIKKIKNK